MIEVDWLPDKHANSSQPSGIEVSFQWSTSSEITVDYGVTLTDYKPA